MKKFLIIISIIFMLLPLGTTAGAQADPVAKLHVDLSLLLDGSIRVSEEITVVGESVQGLERILPIWYQTKDGLDYVVDYRAVDVLMDGVPVSSVTRYSRDGLHINWDGQPGEHTYTIQYISLRQVEFFEDYDCLHWNLTGRHWQVPIEQVTGTVSFPDVSFIGIDGYDKLQLNQIAEGTLEFTSLEQVAPGQSLWVSVNWPKAWVPREQGGERILQFDSHITINTDNTLEVTETITVLALGYSIRRGIERDFPTVYRDPDSNKPTRVGFNVKSVLRNNNVEPYSLIGLENGTRIRIGDANVFLDYGIHTYTIIYTTDRQLGFYPDYDELTWNVNGAGWELVIDQITCTIILPPEVPRDSLMFAGFTGRQGARGVDWLSFVEENGEIFFASTTQLGRYENMTVAVGWDKGHILPPGKSELRTYWVRDNASSVAALGVLIITALYYLVVLLIRGPRPRRGTIIPRFLPPSGFSPAAVRYLRRFYYDKKCMTASLINMAVLGYHRICQAGTRRYSLERGDAAQEVLAPEEAAVGRVLFSNRTSIEMDQKNHVSFQTAGTRMERELKTQYSGLFRTFRGWFYGGAPVSLVLLSVCGAFYSAEEFGLVFIYVLGFTLWTAFVLSLSIYTVQRWQERSGLGAILVTFLTAGLLALTGLFGYWVARDGTWLLTGSIIAVIALNYFCYYRLPVYTEAGRQVVDEIEGFQLYLRVAEKDRLNILNPPEATPQLFEQYLPYALALGVEQQWAKQFNDVFARLKDQTGNDYSPGWYAGDHWRLSSPVALAATVGGAFAGSVAAASTAPGSSSSSGGGSSFSGGGGSGSGGGGGGGRGW